MTLRLTVQQNVVRAVSVLVSVVRVALTWHVIERVPVNNMLARCCCTAGKMRNRKLRVSIKSRTATNACLLCKMRGCQGLGQ